MEAVARLRRLGVLRHVQVVSAVMPRHAERPGATRRVCKPRNVDRGDDAGGEKFVVEHVALFLLFETHQAAFCSMGSRGEFPPPADPDVSGLVRPARVEQRDIRPDRGYQDEIAFLGRGFGDVVPYVVMVAVLLVRPSGLFGTREMTRV